VKGSPFEVVLLPQLSTKGCVVTSDVRTQDYLARGVQFIEKAPERIVRSYRRSPALSLGASETL
jgi:hypothetical protein